MERGSTRLGGRPRRRRIFEPITEAQWLCSYWLKRADRRLSSSFAQHLRDWGIIASA